MERLPCLLPIPGMVVQIHSYARKDTTEEAKRAQKMISQAAQAGTILMCPDEAPPLATGNIESN